MADQTLASVFNALGVNVRKDVVRQINRRARLLQMIKMTPSKNKNVTWDLSASGANAENYADGDDVSAFGSDALAQASLAWGLVRGNFAITDQAIAAVGMDNPAGLVRLARKNLGDAAQAMTSKLNVEAYSGTGTGGQMAGLCSVAIKTDNTYATVDRTDSANAYFRGNVLDLSGAPVALTHLRTMLGETIFNACGEQPQVGMCSAAVFNKVGALFDATRRQEQEVTIDTARGPITLKAGLGMIDIDGTVLIKDKDVPSGEIVFLNLDYVEGEYLPLSGEVEMPEATVVEAAQDGFGPIPLGYKVVELGRTGAKRKFSMMANVQIVVTRPNTCGRIINIG
jgi:hypothetical protein